MSPRLNSAQIDTHLEKIGNWTLDAHKASIRKAWTFDSFKTAMNFFVSVGAIAEELDHHPEFLFNYNKMRIRLTTHDAYGLTHKDFDLAGRIDQLVGQQFSNLVQTD
jgi:4a-hydroxytetrahydrobiopterin dehydratase